MDDLEKTIRKIDLKEASGLNTDKEYAHVLELLGGTIHEGFDPAKVKENTIKKYAGTFYTIPHSEP